MSKELLKALVDVLDDLKLRKNLSEDDALNISDSVLVRAEKAIENYLTQPEQKPSSDDYYKNIELRKEVQTKTKQEPKVCPNKMRSGSCMLPDPLCGYPNCEK